MKRIITRILLAFWALWFGLHALASFGADGQAMSDAVSPTAALPGLWIGFAMVLVSGLFLWAFMAATVNEGGDDADVVVINKIAFSAAAAWLAGHCLFQASAAGNPLAPDGLSLLTLLLVSFVVALREEVWTTVAMAEERRSNAAASAMAAAASYQAELVRISGRHEPAGGRV